MSRIEHVAPRHFVGVNLRMLVWGWSYHLTSQREAFVWYFDSLITEASLGKDTVSNHCVSLTFTGNPPAEELWQFHDKFISLSLLLTVTSVLLSLSFLLSSLHQCCPTFNICILKGCTISEELAPLHLLCGMPRWLWGSGQGQLSDVCSLRGTDSRAQGQNRGWPDGWKPLRV